MTRSRSDLAQEVFAAAIACPPEQRGTVLEELCADDPALRFEVESLLAHDATAPEEFMRPPERAAHHEAPQADSGPDPRLGRQIGRFTIKSVIASGGMGTVYRAQQDYPQRDVALKIIRPELASPSGLRRFELESQLLAYLRHPNIAHVYEAGIHQEQTEGGAVRVPFFAMEYVEGARPITDYVNEEGLSTADRLRLFTQVCDAVHHGHQRGIIHRDLKPANVLVDASGQPKIIDFGVARATDADLTVTTVGSAFGSVVGTLQYMSPEQCAGDAHQVDVRSDVYALGVILYELLCGQRPYDVSTSSVLEGARIIREQAPVRPSRINRIVRGDLETIVLKALEKDRDRRYGSATELAADIRCYLDHEPIAARPPSFAYSAGKFARRHPWKLATVCAITLLVVATVIVALSTSYARQLENARKDEKRAREEAVSRRQQAEITAYGAKLAEAEAALTVNNAAGARTILDATDPSLRQWEWEHLRARVDLSQNTLPLLPNSYPEIFNMDVSAKGERIAVGFSSPDEFRLLSYPGGSRLPGDFSGIGHVECVAFASLGNAFATVTRQETAADSATNNYFVTIWSTSEEWPEYRKVAHWLASQASSKRAVFHPNRLLLATTSGLTIRLWDVSRIEEHQGRCDVSPVEPDAELRGHDEPPVGLAFSPNAPFLASASEDCTVRLWDVDAALSRREPVDLAVLQGHTHKVMCVAFSPDGERLASGGMDGTIRIWNVGDNPERARLARLTGGYYEFMTIESRVLAGHQGGVLSLAFDSSGGRLLSGGTDGSVRVWDVRETAPFPNFAQSRYQPPPRGELVSQLRGHEDWVIDVRWLPNGDILSAGRDGIMKRWLQDVVDIPQLVGHSSSVIGAGFSVDNRFVVTFGDESIIIWDADLCVPVCRRWLRRTTSHECLTNGVCWNNAGRSFLATASRCSDKAHNTGRVVVWELHPSKGSVELESPITVAETPQGFGCIAVSSDGRRLAAECVDDDAIRVWEITDLGNVRELQRLGPTNAPGHAVTFLDDAGRWLASITTEPGGEDSDDGCLPLWDVDSGEEVAHTHLMRSRVLKCNAQKGRLAVGLADGTVALWSLDWRNGTVQLGELKEFEGHTAPVLGLAFHPTESRLASGSTDGTVKVWDLRTGIDVATLRTQPAWVADLAFSSDGTRMVSCSGGMYGLDNVARVWETNVTPELRRRRAVAMRAYQAVREVMYTVPASPAVAQQRIQADPYLPEEVKKIALERFEAFLPHPEKVLQLADNALKNPTADMLRGSLEWVQLVRNIAPENENIPDLIMRLEARLNEESKPSQGQGESATGG